MRDYLEIGCTPTEEPCYPAGHPLARAECGIYMQQLQRQFPKAELQIRRNPHDFGSYYEVAAYFNDHDDAAHKSALEVEANTPDYWDDESKQALLQLKNPLWVAVL